MKYFRKYQKAEEKFNPYYAAMVESIDEGVGRIIQFLRDNHLLESTIIVFTSDNGGLGIDELGPTPTSNLPLRMWKGHVYEGGIRVPAIISWQGKIKQAQISNDYFCSIDFFPTICEIAGIDSMPENIDGISILPFLIGKNRSIEQRPLLWHYPNFSNQMGRPAGAVRIGDYKLVENYETGQLELFNLRTDISESVDLSGKMQQRTKDLHEILVKWRKEVGAKYGNSKS
jgi:arylsulfatase A-like enzyme